MNFKLDAQNQSRELDNIEKGKETARINILFEEEIDKRNYDSELSSSI